MSNPLAGQDALFNQYESEYCNKSTEITRKIQAFGGLQGGEQATMALLHLLLPLFQAAALFTPAACPCRLTCVPGGPPFLDT